MAIRLPEQRRSQRSLSRLLDAAEQLMAHQDFDEISIAAIVKAARTSVGNFYGRFSSKEALLEALHQRYQDDRNALWNRFFSDASVSTLALEERVKRFVTLIIKNYRARTGVFRTLVMRQWRHPDSVDPRNRELLGDLYRKSAVFLLGRKSEIRHPNPERAVEVGIAAVLAACREHIVLRPGRMPGSLKVSDDVLAVELSRMLLGYLRAG